MDIIRKHFLHIFNKPIKKIVYKYKIIFTIIIMNNLNQDPLIDILNKEIIPKFDDEWK